MGSERLEKRLMMDMRRMVRDWYMYFDERRMPAPKCSLLASLAWPRLFVVPYGREVRIPLFGTLWCTTTPMDEGVMRSYTGARCRTRGRHRRITA